MLQDPESICMWPELGCHRQSRKMQVRGRDALERRGRRLDVNNGHCGGRLEAAGPPPSSPTPSHRGQRVAEEWPRKPQRASLGWKCRNATKVCLPFRSDFLWGGRVRRWGAAEAITLQHAEWGHSGHQIKGQLINLLECRVTVGCMRL